ncbi:MAG: acyltransferase [Aliivibrio sp.]|nr:acyltransferase [Aliivibrio sp.]
MVFYAHITAGYNMHVHGLLGLHTDFGSIQFFISNIGVFGVEIFFFLSGFVILKSSMKENAKTFFVRRFFRIYPIFFLFSIVFIVGNIITGMEPEKNNIGSILLALSFTNLFFDSPALTPNSWSVVYEVWYYFGLYYVVSIFVRKEKTSIIGILSVLVLLWFVVTKPITIYFLLGALTAFNINKIEFFINRFKAIWVNSLSLLSIVVLVYLVSQGIKFGHGGWLESISSNAFFLPTLLLISVAFTFHKGSNVNHILTNKTLVFFGNISYTLYLLHPYTYRASRYLIGIVDFQHQEVRFLVFLILSSLVTFFASYILGRFFEMPIYRRFSKKDIYNSSN